MSGETSTASGEGTTDMRSEQEEGASLFWTWLFPWGILAVSVALLLLSFWLQTAGPVDEGLFTITSVVALIYAVLNTLNEIGVISL